MTGLDHPDPLPDAAPDVLDTLLPAPRHVRAAPDGTLRLDASARLDAGPGTATAARALRRDLGVPLGLDFPESGDGPVVRLRIDASAPPEAYVLTVGAEGVRITGGGPAGVYYGVQTLRQLAGPQALRRAPLTAAVPAVPGAAPVPVPAPGVEIPYTEIEDSPRFAWRGHLLDVARHFLPKDSVLRTIDLLAAHKLNVLHFHLTDDQGWRIEIKRHPKLMETAAWRPRTKRGHRTSELWDETPHGGYYTQDDLREIVAYAAERHVTVVPEIDVPGHSQAAIAAYPHLGNSDVVDTEALGVWETWGVNPNVLAPTEEVLRFYEDVFTEVLDVFPSTFFHIGGDECPKDQWKASETAQKRIAELGVGDEDGLQSWFIRHFDTWLTARGRRLIGWDEILEGGLAPGATVTSWRGYAGGITAARAGHDVVMCPEQQVYLDFRQAGGEEEPVPIGWVRTMEDIYRFEPVPPELTSEEARHVLGAQANSWAEVMDSQDRRDYQTFPRLAAFSEVVWSELPAPDARDYEGFARRMDAAHYARLDALGVAYRPKNGPKPWQRRPGVGGFPREGKPPRV
ncbi:MULTISPECIES: beta-N-acetylhexosaminidase [Streptomyces]|uniref:beta-N-acetylhexosaminidase n=1 Tax=Streptomyces evansiae TaxID=3075535 RepID=A0ABU2R8V3_9ACTN|nr:MULTISPECIES: beta-N-acetylhexosaminidase [unclassified Streptomyces]MDT0413127.1 beta-N-acetylhexosaminidase [Streptomyces sp. DSM 41979]MYQ61222.1 family 20 glycosylhydrolase [Streptomyces sp. SID4926]